VVRRIDGGPSVVVEDASSLAYAFFSGDPSSVGPKAYDERARRGDPNRITVEDVRTINQTMRARARHSAWETVTGAGPLPWLAALDPSWDLIELPDREWERLGCTALLEAVFAAAIGPYRQLAVATKGAAPEAAPADPILDSSVVEQIGGGGRPALGTRRAGPTHWVVPTETTIRRALARVDADHLAAVLGAWLTNRHGPDRRRQAVAVDGTSLPLAVTLTGGNRHDSTHLIALVDAVPPVRGRPGRSRRRPDQVASDRAYDARSHRAALRARGVHPVLARRGVGHGSGLGRVRWVVERFFGWLHNSYRRLATRWEYRADIHFGFMKSACCLICWRRLQPSF
jgi:transposase